MNKLIRMMIGVSFGLLLPLFASAELVVIVNPENEVDSLTIEEINKLFLGKKKEYSPGNKATPIDLKKGDVLRSEFYKKVIKKTPNQLNSYWSRVVFTGKGEPPKYFSDQDDILDMVSEEPDMIGYIDAETADDSVKIVYKVP